MRDIILVLNDEPPKVIRTPNLKREIVYLRENNLLNSLPVQIRFVSFRDGRCGALLIAAERFVSTFEALNLHYELNPKNKPFKESPIKSLKSNKIK